MAAPDPSQRGASLETVPAFSKGWFEVQDLASQIAAEAAGEIRGAQVLDLCAGGGGKALALAAAMANKGQIYAYDSEARRLADTVRRSERAGVRNLQVRSPIYPNPLKDLENKIDVVFIDAPCSGTGAWRRHPDTKWRLKPALLTQRMADQDAVLDLGTQYGPRDRQSRARHRGRGLPRALDGLPRDARHQQSRPSSPPDGGGISSPFAPQLGHRRLLRRRA